MTLRLRSVVALLAMSATLVGTAGAAPKPAAPKVKQEVITIERTAKHGLAALALIGKVKADRAAGFFATVDRTKSSALVGVFADFNDASGLARYGHGSSAPLCNAPVICELDLASDTLTFSITETSDADATYDPWRGLTRYLAIRGTSIDLQVAAIGFTVRRHTSSSFTRVTREQADTDGVALDGIGAEVFRAAQARGGDRGSFAALQLPCDVQGAGAVTFTATGDTLPPEALCLPTDGGPPGTVYVMTVGVSRYHERPGLYSRTSARGTQWQVSGLVSGVSIHATRLFVLNY